MPWETVAGLIGVGCLVMLYRIGRNRKRRQRAQFFGSCLELFQRYRVVQDDLAYPVLSGAYRDREVRLEPVVDHLAWRKLPVLWLKISVLEPNPHGAVLDFLMRPLGTEFYSPSGHLDYHLRIPESWPQDAILCSDGPTSSVLPERVTPHMALFDNPKMKELVVTPKGVRLVDQVCQASRPQYLVFREIRFDVDRLDAHTLQPLLEAAIAIAESVSKPASLSKVA
jgi:hypothetical protein